MRIKTRMAIVLFGGLLIVGAAYKDNMAAEYVAIFGTWLAYAIHAIEVRLNKLLDDRGLIIVAKDLDD
jgi:hypothetical protein